MTLARRTLAVLGLGNVVMSDDGLGVHALARLRARRVPQEHVVLVEGGTAGLLLLPHLADARRAIIVDAIDTGAAPGTLVRLDVGASPGAFSAAMTPHDVGLRDLLGAAQLTGAWPEWVVLHGIQPQSTAVGAELSRPVAAAMNHLVDRLVAEVIAFQTEGHTTSRTGHDCRKEAAPWPPPTPPQHRHTPPALH